MSEGENAEKAPKLPYFHRELSSADQALLSAGNKNAPQRISAEDAKAIDDTSSGSAWNSAQSWEEKDFTAGCKVILGEVLDNANSSFSSVPDVKITGCDVENIDGHANVTHSRGKARFLYEFTCSLTFEVTSSKQYKGTLKLVDLTNDQDCDDYDMMIEWKAPSPSGKDSTECRKKVLSDGIREALYANMALFLERFKALASVKA